MISHLTYKADARANPEFQFWATSHTERRAELIQLVKGLSNHAALLLKKKHPRSKRCSPFTGWPLSESRGTKPWVHPFCSCGEHRCKHFACAPWAREKAQDFLKLALPASELDTVLFLVLFFVRVDRYRVRLLLVLLRLWRYHVEDLYFTFSALGSC